MKKVACLIYPHFSLYEMATLTSCLVLNFGVTVDYIASQPDSVLSEDGLSCQPTKLISEVNLDDYSCLILPGMIDFIPALKDKVLIDFLSSLKGKDTLIATISSAPILLAKAGLLKDKKFTGGIWQNFFDYFDFLPKENFKPKTVYQDENIITAIGFAHQEFARRVLISLGLTNDASNYFIERQTIPEGDLLFKMPDEEFEHFKEQMEQPNQDVNK